MKRRNIISGVFWVVIGLGLLIWTVADYKIGTLTHPETGYMPMILGVLLIFLSLVLLLGELKGDGVAEPVAPSFSLQGWKRVAYAVLLLLTAAFFFEEIGYLPIFFGLVVLLMKGIEPHLSWKQVLLTALLTAVVVYVIFVKLLEVQLPRGFLGI